MVPEDRPEIPEPNGEKIEPHRIIPIYEANAFSEFRAPEDILILISDIEKRPNQFTPEKIKQAFEYARDHFRRVVLQASASTKFPEWERPGYNDIYRVTIFRNPHDRDVIDGAIIQFLGIALHDDSIVDREGIDALVNRSIGFNNHLALKPDQIFEDGSLLSRMYERAKARGDDTAVKELEEYSKRPHNPTVVVVPPGKRVTIPDEVFERYNMKLGLKKDHAGVEDRVIGLRKNLEPILTGRMSLAFLYDGDKPGSVIVRSLSPNQETIRVRNFNNKDGPHLYECLVQNMLHDNTSFENLGPSYMPLFFSQSE